MEGLQVQYGARQICCDTVFANGVLREHAFAPQENRGMERS